MKPIREFINRNDEENDSYLRDRIDALKRALVEKDETIRVLTEVNAQLQEQLYAQER